MTSNDLSHPRMTSDDLKSPQCGKKYVSKWLSAYSLTMPVNQVKILFPTSKSKLKELKCEARKYLYYPIKSNKGSDCLCYKMSNENQKTVEYEVYLMLLKNNKRVPFINKIKYLSFMRIQNEVQRSRLMIKTPNRKLAKSLSFWAITRIQ